MKLSKGFKFSVPMLVLMVLEFLGFYLEFTTGFSADKAGFFGSTAGIFLFILVALCVLQLIGILLVTAELYRIGGIFQIVASAFHVPDLMGIIGIIGGLRAYRYPAALINVQNEDVSV